MNVLIDTNILIDIFMKRENLAQNSETILNQIEAGEMQGIIAAHSIPTLYYLIHKKIGQSQTLNIISELLQICQVGALSHKVITSAMKLTFSDYEDALISEIAHRENCEYIITHNTRDFKKSTISAITPANFLKLRTV